MERWKGKVALVTGASSGIGRACAEALARSSMRVVLAARRQDRLEELEHALQREGLQALSLRVDLRRELDILTLFERIRRHWGGVDVLVNNAGLGHLAPLMSGDTESWREMWEINVLGLSICSREVVRDLQQRGGEGHIIHISSMSGHRVPPGSGMYAATKHAVRALTEALRMELHEAGSPARVSAISPGFVETEFAERYHRDPRKAAETYQRYKVLEAEDIAQAMLYQLSQPPWCQVHDILMRPQAQPL